MNMKWGLIAFLFYILIVLGLPVEANAHGARIEYKIDMNIEIVATYDNCAPMSDAQVVVYAPDDPANPWLTGACDAKGRFIFNPDVSKPGMWDIQVRQAGHGDMIHISIGEETEAASGDDGYTAIQIAFMSVCVIWGFAGTALYFLRKKA